MGVSGLVVQERGVTKPGFQRIKIHDIIILKASTGGRSTVAFGGTRLRSSFYPEPRVSHLPWFGTGLHTGRGTRTRE